MLLRRDFLIVALGLVVPVKMETSVPSEPAYDDPALGCTKCGELRFSQLEFLDTPDAPDMKCHMCGTLFDSEAHYK